MKKTLMAIATFGALFMNASNAASDLPNGIMVYGNVTSARNCSIQADQTTFNLLTDSESLIKQGSDATNPKLVHVSVGGGDSCANQVEQGMISFKFLGTADESDGTVIANTLTDSSASKGVGIAIFDENNKLIPLNSGILHATNDTVFGIQMVQLNNQEIVAGNINSTMTMQIERL